MRYLFIYSLLEIIRTIDKIKVYCTDATRKKNSKPKQKWYENNPMISSSCTSYRWETQRERENENREIWLEQIDNDKEDEKKTWDQEKMRFRILSLFLSVHSNWDSALLLFISSSYVREDTENSITDPISLEEYWSIRELTLCVFVWNDKDEVIHWQ